MKKVLLFAMLLLPQLLIHLLQVSLQRKQFTIIKG